jgi:small subunit ribosomal protein S20
MSPYYAARKFPLAAQPDKNMPNTASAKKRLRQNEKLRIHNRAKKSALRTQIRKVREAVQAGDTEKSQAELRLTQKRIDQAAAKNLIHKNAAARTKSRLVKLVKAAG